MKTNNYTNSCEMFNVKWQLIKFRACHDSRFGYEIAVVADAGYKDGRGRSEEKRGGADIEHLAEFIVAFNEQHMRLSL